MIELDSGEFTDPWFGPNRLARAPWIHPTALVRSTRFGEWTVVGERCQVLSSIVRDYSYMVRDAEIFNADVGKFCNIAANVRINAMNHPLSRASLHNFTYRSSVFGFGDDDHGLLGGRLDIPATIGPDVWIGHGAVILPGISVGAGAVIGAGSVVTKDVEDYAIVAGNPAAMIRRRVNEEVAQALKRISWWDWTHEQIGAAIEDFRNFTAVEFAEKYDRN